MPCDSNYDLIERLSAHHIKTVSLWGFLLEMNMSESHGWISLHRKMLDWEWYSDHNTTRLFIHMLLRANHKEKKWRGITIPAGSFISGRRKLALETGLSEQQIRTSLLRLKSTSELTSKSTSCGTLFTLLTWNSYQGNQPAKQPQNNQQSTTNNNDNNNNNINVIMDSAISEKGEGEGKESSETLAVETEEVKPDKFYDKDRKYAVHGHVMKYTLEDYNRFKKEFSKWLEPYDFIRELESLDEWLFSLPKKDRKNWPIKIRRIMEKKYHGQAPRGLL